MSGNDDDVCLLFGEGHLPGTQFLGEVGNIAVLHVGVCVRVVVVRCVHVGKPGDLDPVDLLHDDVVRVFLVFVIADGLHAVAFQKGVGINEVAVVSGIQHMIMRQIDDVCAEVGNGFVNDFGGVETRISVDGRPGTSGKGFLIDIQAVRCYHLIGEVFIDRQEIISCLMRRDVIRGRPVLCGIVFHGGEIDGRMNQVVPAAHEVNDGIFRLLRLLR